MSAKAKIIEALDACKEVISQRSLFSRAKLRERLQDKLFVYLAIATILALGLGIAFYAYKKVMLKKALEENVVKEEGLKRF